MAKKRQSKGARRATRKVKATIKRPKMAAGKARALKGKKAMRPSKRKSKTKWYM